MKAKKLLSALLAALLAVLCSVPAVAIDSEGVASLEELGLSYSTQSYTDSEGGTGTVHSLVYDPETAGIMAYVDNGNAGWGYKTLSTAERIETMTDYNVIAGVNAEFFSMSSGTSGVLVGYGMYITDGRVAQADTAQAGNVLAFGSDGSVDYVSSKLAYTVKVDGEEWTYNNSTALAFINKRSSTWANGIYLWDSCCGTKTDSVESTPGVEIVCEKKDFTEISVGRTCTAEVVEVRTDSYNSPFEADQFVLFVKNDSPLAEYAKSIQVGSQIDISVEETVEGSAEIMENASSVTSVLYAPFVVNGAKVESAITPLPAYNIERPRTGLGIKADGTVVVLVAEGDGANGANGVDCYEFADMFIAAGCVTAFNFDGGGSSQIVLDNNGTLEQVYGLGRGVGNSLLFVERKGAESVNSELRQALAAAIESVTDDMMEENAVKVAYDAAVAVTTDGNAMGSDYRAALYDLNAAIGGRTKLVALVKSCADLEYSDYSATAWRAVRAGLETAIEVLESDTALSGDYSDAYAALTDVIALSGSYSENVALGKSYTRTGVWSATPNYDDANNTELTDGDLGTPGYGACWTGFHHSFREDGYYRATLDLGQTYTGLKEVVMHIYYDPEAGCALPKNIYVQTSDTTEFGEVVGTNSNIPIPDGVTIVKPAVELDASGRYVNIRWDINGYGNFSFVSEIQVFNEYTPENDPVPENERELPTWSEGGDTSEPGVSGDVSEGGETPDTGDSVILTALLVIIVAAVAAVAIRKARR